MQRILLFPLSLLGGLLATMVARKTVNRVWAAADEEEAITAPDRRDVSTPRLIAGFAIEGAIFSVARGITDRGLHRAVEWATGDSPDESRTTSPDREVDKKGLPDPLSTHG